MRVQQIGFAVLDDSVRILEIGFSFTNGFHFGAPKRETGFEFIQQKVVMSRGAIHGGVPFPSSNWFPGFRFLHGWSSWLGGVTLLPGHTFGYESSC
jgi:hypothetical protein